MQTPQEYADWFLSWCNPYGVAMNIRRDITLKKYRDEADRAELEEALHIVCLKHPDVAYIEERYLAWKQDHSVQPVKKGTSTGE